jgi:hypothetical protein
VFTAPCAQRLHAYSRQAQRAHHRRRDEEIPASAGSSLSAAVSEGEAAGRRAPSDELSEEALEAEIAKLDAAKAIAVAGEDYAAAAALKARIEALETAREQRAAAAAAAAAQWQARSELFEDNGILTQGGAHAIHRATNTQVKHQKMRARSELPEVHVRLRSFDLRL